MEINKKTYFHAIRLIEENCTGCTKCVRICPTEALRVHEGIVHLDPDRCIDCGNCVTVCPFKAIISTADSLSEIDKFKYKLAILSTTYAGQISESIGYKKAKTAILNLGFDDVAEESMITNQMTKLIREYVKTHKNIRPVISSNCPSVVRLIQVRFPDLLPNILPIEAPMSVLATYYRDKISFETGLNMDEIGIFLVVPCISQVTAVHQPEGTYKNLQNGAIAVSEIYSNTINDMRDIIEDENEIDVFEKGLSWAISGMQAEEICDNDLKTMAVSGVHNVNKILQKIESQQLEQYDFIVLDSCTNGCVGGILNIENPFVATSRIRNLLRNAESKEFHGPEFEKMYRDRKFSILPLEPRSIVPLDDNIKVALKKMKEINKITKNLPGLDCSACGSPTCRTLAEDIVAKKASVSDCVVLLRNKKKKYGLY